LNGVGVDQDSVTNGQTDRQTELHLAIVRPDAH